ncbi:MAG: hypothetical protein Rhob2KO_51340 [Rhodopirellula baltica]
MADLQRTQPTDDEFGSSLANAAGYDETESGYDLFFNRPRGLTTRLDQHQGTKSAVPVTAAAWYQAPFRLNGTGGMIQGAQLPGR